MSLARAKRVERLIALRSRAVDIANAAVAQAIAAADHARRVHSAADAKWSEAALSTLRPRTSTSAEVQETYQYIAGLRRRVDAAADGVEQADAQVERARAELSDTRQNLRKLELWRDGMVAEVEGDTRRRERVAEDELAARMRPARSA